MRAPDGPETWVVAADHAGLDEAVRAARGAGRRLLLWSPEPHMLAAETRILADGCFPLLSVLSHHHPEPVARPLAGSVRVAPRSGVSAQIRSVTVREAEVPRDASPQPPIVPGSRLAPWVRLVYHTESLLRRNRWSKVAFRKLSSSLAEIEEFGPTAANALMWLNRAKAEGMLLVEQETHRADPTVRMTVCRPNPEHPVCRAALEVPDRCLRLLYQMLQKMPWVSFKLLRSVLLRDQWLGGPPHQLDEAAIDEWLNFLIHDGAIDMRKEPNLANPEFPVTALRLSDHHPLARSVAAEAVEGSRLAAERAILAVDHFLTRNRKPWMAMTALRRVLEGMGREELQEVLQGLQKLGALITESYPNPQKEHFTTGCRLGTDQPLVVDALRTRNAIIRAAQHHQRYRSWVPLSRVEEDLATDCWRAAPAGHRLAWFLLLRDEGILEVEQDGLLPDGTWKNARCRLNVADAVVRAVVAELLPELAGAAAELQAPV